MSLTKHMLSWIMTRDRDRQRKKGKGRFYLCSQRAVRSETTHTTTHLPKQLAFSGREKCVFSSVFDGIRQTHGGAESFSRTVKVFCRGLTQRVAVSKSLVVR